MFRNEAVIMSKVSSRFSVNNHPPFSCAGSGTGKDGMKGGGGGERKGSSKRVELT